MAPHLTEHGLVTAPSPGADPRGEHILWSVVIFILDFALPPLAVFLQCGIVDWKFWLALILTIFAWVPGIIFALFIFFTQPRAPVTATGTDLEMATAKQNANAPLAQNMATSTGYTSAATTGTGMNNTVPTMPAGANVA
eukprot:SM000110S18915  [mRNA]  locus=s110:413077:414074:+ [translate_table: standard]